MYCVAANCVLYAVVVRSHLSTLPLFSISNRYNLLFLVFSDGTLHAQHSGSLFGLVLEMDTQLENYVGITESMGFGVSKWGTRHTN